MMKVLKETKLGKFKGLEFYPADKKRCLVTKEGEAVVKEAIEYLNDEQKEINAQNNSSMSSSEDPNNTSNVPNQVYFDTLKTIGASSSSETEKPESLPLIHTHIIGNPSAKLDFLHFNPVLGLTAEDHGTDIGSVGIASHVSSDQETKLVERAGRYGFWKWKVGECLWYGQPTTGYQIVQDLVVDDGVPSRGHRLGVFDKAYHFVGIHINFYKTFGYCAVIVFAHTFYPDADLVGSRFVNGPAVIKPAKNAKIQTQWKTLGVCSACGGDIQGGSMIDGGPKTPHKWHKDCFHCVECQGSLVGLKYFLEKKQLYCEDCHTEKFAKTCAGCNQKIKGVCMTAIGKPWHPDCFKCDECGTGLKGGKYQTDANTGQVFCMTCLNKKMNAAKAGGKAASSGMRGKTPANSSGGVALPGISTSSRPGSTASSTGGGKATAKASSTSNVAAKASAASASSSSSANPKNPSAGGGNLSKAAMDAIVGNKHMMTGKHVAKAPTSAKAQAKAPKVKTNFAVAANAVNTMGMNYSDF